MLDENDNSPVFLPSPPNVTVAEDAGLGTEVATVRARDGDSGELGKGRGRKSGKRER